MTATTVCGKEGLRGREADLGLFAAGGKDGHPYRVDRATYDRTIEVLRRAPDRSKVDRSEKVAALKRLARVEPTSDTVSA